MELWLLGWIGNMMGRGKETHINGQFILTSQRVVFFSKRWFGETYEAIPLDKITSVETHSMAGYRVLRIHTSNDELAFKTFESKEAFDSVCERIEQLRKKLKAPAESNASSPVDQIARLASLRDAGAITNEEFAAKKSELLSRI